MPLELPVRPPTLAAQLQSVINDLTTRADAFDAREAAMVSTIAVAADDELAHRRWSTVTPDSGAATITRFEGLYATEAQRLRAHAAGLRRVLELLHAADPRLDIMIALTDLVTLGLLPKSPP